MPFGNYPNKPDSGFTKKAACVYCGTSISQGKRRCSKCAHTIDKERSDPKYKGYY